LTEINLTFVGPSPTDGSYGDNFHLLGSRRKLGDLTLSRVWPGLASTPTLTSSAATCSNLSPPLARRHPPASTPPPPLQPMPPRAPPHPGRRVAPAPVRSNRRAAASTPRSSSTPRSNCSPAWPAPPRRRLLYSQCLPELLHTPTILSPWPRSDQADAPPHLHPGSPPCPGPTAARGGRLLHAATSSATGAFPSSSMPRPSCRPGLGPIKLTCRCLYAPTVLHASVQLQPGVSGSSMPLPPLQSAPP
jgi:hypothetical protein